MSKGPNKNTQKNCIKLNCVWRPHTYSSWRWTQTHHGDHSDRALPNRWSTIYTTNGLCDTHVALDIIQRRSKRWTDPQTPFPFPYTSSMNVLNHTFSDNVTDPGNTLFNKSKFTSFIHFPRIHRIVRHPLPSNIWHKTLCAPQFAYHNNSFFGWFMSFKIVESLVLVVAVWECYWWF